MEYSSKSPIKDIIGLRITHISCLYLHIRYLIIHGKQNQKYEDPLKMEKFGMKTRAMKMIPNENSENADHEYIGLS